MNEIELITDFVAKHYGITTKQLKSPSRKREFVEPRQVAHWLAKRHTKLSLATIGANIGFKNHDTVIHSVKTVSNVMTSDAKFFNRVMKLNEDLVDMLNPIAREKYNFDVLLKERSDRRFEIQRKHFEEQVAEIHNLAQKVLQTASKALDESQIIEGYLKAKIMAKIEIALKKLKDKNTLSDCEN